MTERLFFKNEKRFPSNEAFKLENFGRSIYSLLTYDKRTIVEGVKIYSVNGCPLQEKDAIFSYASEPLGLLTIIHTSNFSDLKETNQFELHGRTDLIAIFGNLIRSYSAQRGYTEEPINCRVISFRRVSE